MKLSDRQNRLYLIDGKEVSKEEAVHRYLPLVKHIARRHFARMPHSVELNDLINDGVLGLLDALEKYDGSRGVKFETYAAIRINGSVADGSRSADWVPRRVREGTRRVGTACTQLETKLRRAAGAQEIADYLQITVEEFHKLKYEMHIATLSSLSDSTTKRGENDVILEDKLRDNTQDTTLDIRRREANTEVLAAVSVLPHQERMLILLHYFKGVAIKDIARLLDVSASRISQIRSRAMMHLREHFQAAQLFYIDQYQDLIA